MHELDKIQLMLSEELEETDSPEEDLVILTYFEYIKEKLTERINRTFDRCGEEWCIRKSTHFDSNGVAKCKYH
jgi:hypothetical protein